MTERRHGWTREVVLLIIITITGWASSAGMMWQHISDVDSRVERLERKIEQMDQKVDSIIFTQKEDRGHGQTR